MSKLGDFLSENSISSADVAARSEGLERFNAGDRSQKSSRREARRLKKTYADANTPKPAKLGRGVTERSVAMAIGGSKVTRTVRKKITRAVSSILTSKKKSPVDWRALFADVGSKKGKTVKAGA